MPSSAATAAASPTIACPRHETIVGVNQTPARAVAGSMSAVMPRPCSTVRWPAAAATSGVISPVA